MFKFLKNSDNKKIFFWIMAALLFAIIFFSLLFVLQKYFSPQNNAVILESDENAVGKTDVCQNCKRRMVDGVYVKEGEDNIFPFAVIIENHPEARPQSGVSKANLVYEAEAEGGITRFLAFYASGENISEIGPVRSARPYFIDWAREVSALFVHVGGSPEALVKISKESIFDLNEFYNGRFFWRKKERFAPHNVYTSSDEIAEFLSNEGDLKTNFFQWKYKDDIMEEERPQSAEIKINFKSPDFVVRWEYDRENNNYRRYIGGRLDYDKLDKSEIIAKNIIIEYVDAEVLDRELRLGMKNIGEGEAILCTDGLCEEGRWVKKTSSARSNFIKSDGGEFEFNAGTTWVEIVRPEREVIY